MARLLLVEDDELVGTMIRMNLEAEANEVVWLRDGAEALTPATREPFDLILLDIGLPGMEGMELLEELRGRGVGTPVLMITALSDVPTKVRALELGADDYLSKPFDVAEMVARVRALVRRSQAERELPADRVIRFGSYELNLETREAITNEGPMVLPEKETTILGLLARAGGQTLSRPDIIEEVWGMDAFPTERTVDNYLVRLRRLFEPEPDRPRHILTVRGAGYRFVQ